MSTRNASTLLAVGFTVFLCGCLYLTEDEQKTMSDNAIYSLIPKGGVLVEILTKKVPKPNKITRGDSWSKGTEIIYKFKGRCFYARKGYFRTPDQTYEVDC